jgi:hypothetical protein
MVTTIAILGLIVMFFGLVLSAYILYLVENKGQTKLRLR